MTVTRITPENPGYFEELAPEGLMEEEEQKSQEIK